MVAAQLQEQHGVTVTALPADIADAEAIRRVRETLLQLPLIGILVSTAGTSVSGDFAEAPLEQLRRMLMLDVQALPC